MISHFVSVDCINIILASLLTRRINFKMFRKFQVLEHGVGLSTHSDSELITQALCLNPPEGEPNGEPDWPARIKHFMYLAPLSYSLVIMLKNKIYAVRDPYGNRPLCLGKILPFNERKYNNMYTYSKDY